MNVQVRSVTLTLRPRHALGLLVLAGGTAACAQFAWQAFAVLDPRVQAAGLAGLGAALATALGTLPVALQQRSSDRLRDTLLGFGAGVMLAASAFSLVVPALASVRQQGGSGWSAAAIVGAGILIGAALLLALETWIPHEHFIKGRDHPPGRAPLLKRTWLFVFAILLHNLPEGLAIGVAYGGVDALTASALATGIAIQDVPEGLVIALALRGAGYGRGFSVGLGAVSGLIEPVGALAGAALMTVSTALLPWGLAFAAGAMLFVISHEIIPESHRAGHERHATTGLILGFVLMMVLDTALV